MNLRLALRSLWKTPTVAAVAVISLALGIGANAAIFTLFEQMILRALPVPAPDELVNLLSPGPKSGSRSSGNAGGEEAIFSYPMFRDLEQAQTSFTGLAAHCSFGANLAYGGDTMNGQALLVSGSYFEVLGLTPALGRLFGRDDDRTSGAHPLAVLSHATWRNRFDSRQDVLDEVLIVNGQPVTIVGVAPRGFEGTTLGQRPDVFVPISMREQLVPGWKGLDDRRNYWIYLFARLAPGVGLGQAEAAINGPFHNLVREVELPLQGDMNGQQREEFESQRIVLEPGRRGQSRLHEKVRKPLLMLFGVSGLVLVIACANITNLLLVRAARRSGEIAVRLAIGARRRQLVAQLLGESLILAVLGSLLGLLVAQGTLRLLASLLPGGRIGFDLEAGPAFWTFLAVLTLVTGLVGLLPALYGTRADLATTVNRAAGRSSESGAARRFRAVLVAFQITVSMALLISAGLFAKSLSNVSRIDLGVDVEQLATFGLSPELNGYGPAASRALFARVEEEVGALRGVRRVAASMVPLITGNAWTSNVTVQGFTETPGTDSFASVNSVGLGYFATLGIPLLAGREIEDRDDLGAPKVAVVNRAFATKFGLGGDAVGKRMQIGAGGELDIEIVGVTGDTRYSEIKQEMPPIFFIPYRQREGLGSLNFYVRADGEPSQLLASLRAAIARLDPNLPIERLTTMELQVRDSMALDRSLSSLSAAFAVLATILAATGLYGLIAYSVDQRIREIGVRMALGADAARVRGMILRQVGRLTAIGAAIGIVAALALGRAARSLLFGLEADDPTVYVLAVVALGLVAIGAGLLPAQRAARVEPMEALRHS
jgi:predicted permease